MITYRCLDVCAQVGQLQDTVIVGDVSHKPE